MDSDQEFDFYILSGPVGTKIFYQTLIKLTVVNCKIQNCLQCSTSLLTWSICQNGFLLVKGSWNSQNANSASEASKSTSVKTNNDSNVSNNAKTTSQWLVALIFVCSWASVLVGDLTMASFWSILNQVQLFFLLLITRSFIPADVQNVIIGMKFVLNPYEYVSFENTRLYESTIDNFKFPSNNSMLETIGVETESSVYNTSPFFTFIAVVVLAHL